LVGKVRQFWLGGRAGPRRKHRRPGPENPGLKPGPGLTAGEEGVQEEAANSVREGKRHGGGAWRHRRASRAQGAGRGAERLWSRRLSWSRGC